MRKKWCLGIKRLTNGGAWDSLFLTEEAEVLALGLCEEGLWLSPVEIISYAL